MHEYYVMMMGEEGWEQYSIAIEKKDDAIKFVKSMRKSFPKKRFVVMEVVRMSERIISCVKACTGAPAAIQPGAVVAVAEALDRAEDRIESERRSGEFDPLLEEIRAALALYNGTGE